jgi:hypothetical protein
MQILMIAFIMIDVISCTIILLSQTDNASGGTSSASKTSTATGVEDGDEFASLLLGLEGVALRLLHSVSGFTGVVFILELALLAFTFGLGAVLWHPGYLLDMVIVGLSLYWELTQGSVGEDTLLLPPLSSLPHSCILSLHLSLARSLTLSRLPFLSLTLSKVFRLCGIFRLWRVARLLNFLVQLVEDEKKVILNDVEVEKVRIEGWGVMEVGMAMQAVGCGDSNGENDVGGGGGDGNDVDGGSANGGGLWSWLWSWWRRW